MIDHDDVKRLHADSYSQLEISKRLGISLSSVRRVMRVLNLSGHSLGKRVFLDDDFFHVIDNERKAYWLGFLVADGCLAKSAGTRRAIRFFLSDKDKCVIDEFVRDLKYEGKVYFDLVRKNCGVVFNSVRMAEDLVKIGFLDWKNGCPDLMLRSIPDVLIHHFVRGFFDGDGSVVVHQRKDRNSRSVFVVFVADRKDFRILESIRDLISSKVGVSRLDVKFCKTCCIIRWTGNRQIRVIADWMYCGASVFLARKRVRFQFDNLFFVSSLHDFRFMVNTNGVFDVERVSKEFFDLVMRVGWSVPRYDLNCAFSKLDRIKVDSYLRGDEIINGFPYGNKVILSFFPSIWMVARNGPSISKFVDYPNLVKKAVRNFFSIPNRSLSPERFVRELLFVGFSRASLLSCPVTMAAVKKFGLSGRWFDPCAGWGNRLLSAFLLGLDYCGFDPNTFDGLMKLGDWLGKKRSFSYRLFGSRWEDLVWPDFDFVLTSPPFHDKEDYLDGVDYGLFDTWCDSFIGGLIKKCDGRRVVLHVDSRIKDWLVERFDCVVVKLVPLNHHKLSTEYFVEPTVYGE